MGLNTVADLKPFTMPKWGIEMSEGTLARWEVAEGVPFTKGAVIALVETDKITNEIEAEADGCLVRLIAEEQQTLPVGALLAVMGPADAAAEEIAAFIASYKPAGDAASGEKESAASAQDDSPVPKQQSEIARDVAISPSARRAAQAAGLRVEDVTPTGRKGRITRQDVDKALTGKRAPVLRGPIETPGQEGAFASPLARRLAVRHGIDLGDIAGTGPRGRVSKADVLALVEEQPDAGAAPHAVEIIPLSAMRRTIARRLTEAKQAIPHIYLRRRVRADRLMQLRELAGKPGTLNDYLVRACALALCEVPAVNVQVHENEIHRFTHADIAVAVATEKGLITPIIHAADELDVAAIAKRTAALAQRARSGRLQPEEYQGGSFTISNLGGFGVEEFDAIINPPQGAILTVGAARPEPIDDVGAIRIVPVFHLSLSCDHRAIDGVDGARFLEALALLIENPEQL